jgi:CRISPR system Cascade subunit CasD
MEPSRSGVTGLLCCALGWKRDHPLDVFSHLKMATRVDREGKFSTDFQTALQVAKANEASAGTVISNRYFLADASFTVALAGEKEFLAGLHQALRDPYWPIYLGRKAFVPSLPPYIPEGLIAVADDPLKELVSLPLLCETGPQVRFIVEDPSGPEIRNDFPVSFQPRVNVPRRVRTIFLEACPEKGTIQLGE